MTDAEQDYLDEYEGGAAAPTVAVKSLFRRFGRKVALDRVSLEVPKGVVFGLVGENGAGKTTLIRHLLGLLRPQSGRVRVFGLDPAEAPEAVLGRIGYLSEDRDLPNWTRVRELMTYTSAFYPTWDPRYAEELRKKLDLDPEARVRNLSRGERAKAGLLVALAYRPELLILDEPSAGLDAVVRRHILSAIIRTVADEGRTVIFSSHLLDEVERVADRIAMIDHGKIVLSGPLDEIKSGHRLLALRFEEPQKELELPGALLCEGSGRDWSVVCNGRVDELRAAAAGMRGQIVEERLPSLEELFVARVRGSREA